MLQYNYALLLLHTLLLYESLGHKEPRDYCNSLSDELLDIELL